MKALMRISLCLILILLTSALTLATPLISEPGKFALYGAANHFTGGEFNGKEIDEFNSGGMGFVIPILKEISVGYKYGSSNSIDNHYSLEGMLFTREYMFKLNFDKCGSEGSIAHLGVFRDFDGSDFWHLCMGGGLALVNISNDSGNANNLSVFAETQLRMEPKDGGPFAYVGVSYEYHLDAFNLEAGVGMSL